MKTNLIDREVLSNLFGECHDSLNEIFTAFVNSYPETKQNLSSAFCSGNLNSLKRLLHFHGPSFMYLGLPTVADLCKKLEQKCVHAGNHFMIADEFSELIQAIECSYEEVIRETAFLKKAV